MRIIRRLVLALGIVALALVGVRDIASVLPADEPEALHRVRIGMTADECAGVLGRPPDAIVAASSSDVGAGRSPEVERVWYMDQEQRWRGDTIRLRLDLEGKVQAKGFVPGRSDSMLARLLRMLGWAD